MCFCFSQTPPPSPEYSWEPVDILSRFIRQFVCFFAFWNIFTFAASGSKRWAVSGGISWVCSITKNPSSSRDEGSIVFAVPPRLPYKIYSQLLSGTACYGDTLGSVNGARSVKAYSTKSFGLRLPSPFGLCANTGSHLTRFSEFRWRRTSLVYCLYLI